MFQFPGFAHLSMYSDFIGVGCPIRISTDQVLFADPRSFSQLITSFFASESLGIPHTPLFTSFNDSCKQDQYFYWILYLCARFCKMFSL
jgi:hypothetical protein